MIENLQDQLYQLENKQAKGVKLCANIRSWRGEKCPKTLFKGLERENMKNQIILVLHDWDSTYKTFVFYFYHPCLFYP